jgi:hypothetical protein
MQVEYNQEDNSIAIFYDTNEMPHVYSSTVYREDNAVVIYFRHHLQDAFELASPDETVAHCQVFYNVSERTMTLIEGGIDPAVAIIIDLKNQLKSSRV